MTGPEIVGEVAKALSENAFWFIGLAYVVKWAIAAFKSK